MPANVCPIPEGYHNVTPYLIVHDAARALDFYKNVFGATEIMRMPGPGGKISHAEIKIGDSVIMLADEHAEIGARSPQSVGGSPVGLLIYVEDVDRTFAQALAAGAQQKQAVENKFYGDRSGTLVDPFGHQWYVSTHVEDVSPQEMEKRMAAMRQVA